MKFEEYQEKAKETAVYPNLDPKWIYPALGLSGESGEVIEKLKKILRDDNGKISNEKLDSIKKELGDVLWYISALATELGLSLEEIAKDNVKKVQSRKERGFLHNFRVLPSPKGDGLFKAEKIY